MYSKSIVIIRKRFESEVEVNGHLYHPIDIERVRTEHFQVNRFLMDNDGDLDKAYELMIAALKWKKEFGIHERDDQYFPSEFWEKNRVETNGRDREGRLIQWEMQRTQYTFKEINLLIRQFIAHILEKLDRLAGEQGYVLVIDTNGAGLSNVDLEITRFKIAVNNHYPLSLRAMYIVDQPWLLSSIMKIIASFMDPKMRQKLCYLKRHELIKLIDPIYIPVELDGKRDKHNFPDNTIPLYRLQERHNLSDKLVDQFCSYYKIIRPGN